ncbi:Mitochodrial transcription termination factor-related protein [Corchorus olitorius]|uniref:Mitochodrial transcription termination factor-related protein n=1 Tax=Corchorus olitorius TaxID=93759 RepID=A0A1R3IX39_9ROSI|nr:Mitochodrial transcription termination factor-related protein [Corchorus olitorius]
MKVTHKPLLKFYRNGKPKVVDVVVKKNVSSGKRFSERTCDGYLSGNSTDEHSFTFSYLINSCGLSPQSALAASKRVNFKISQKPDSVIRFFRNHGFSQTQITELIKRAPDLLVYNFEKNLLPKFQFFYSRGVSSSNRAEVLSVRPYVLRCSLDRCIIPNFNFFKDFAGCDDDKVLVAYKRFRGVLLGDFQSRAARIVAVLRECGVPEYNMVRMLVEDPSVFGSTSLEKFRRTAEEVKNLGFNPLKYDFFAAVRVLLQLSESTRERKFDVFKDYGWSEKEIVSAFRRFPNCIKYSETKIKATMDFYVNKVGLKSSYIANQPHLLGLSLEKRIIPRFAVFQVLLSNGLVKEKTSITRLLCITEKSFLQMLVTRYEDLHLLKLYEEKLGVSKYNVKVDKITFPINF